jgi:hypothetical protein
MGLRVASDVVDEGGIPDCRVDGREVPFGPISTSLDDGEVALIAAPLHSGAEGFAQYLIVSSRSTEDSLTRSTIVQPIDRLETRATIASDFVSYPTGSVSRANRQLDLTVAAGVTRVRVDFVRDGTGWIVFAPPGTTALPSTPETDDIAANAGTVYVSALRPSGIGSPFDFGEPARIDLAPDAFNAIASVACSAAGELCALDD